MADACGRRFDGRYGELPEGYDHKFVFSHVGFNFKVTDMQAALGLAQLERLPELHAARRRNFARLHAALEPLADRIVLPRALPGADPSWFGYFFTLRDGDSAERRRLQLHLQERRIDSRLVLAGNVTRQPGYLGLDHRIAGPLDNSDRRRFLESRTSLRASRNTSRRSSNDHSSAPDLHDPRRLAAGPRDALPSNSRVTVRRGKRR